MEHACFSTSSGVEIHLKLAVSKVAAKATVLGGGWGWRGAGGEEGRSESQRAGWSQEVGVGSGHALWSPSLENILKA